MLWTMKGRRFSRVVLLEFVVCVFGRLIVDLFDHVSVFPVSRVASLAASVYVRRHLVVERMGVRDLFVDGGRQYFVSKTYQPCR